MKPTTQPPGEMPAARFAEITGKSERHLRGIAAKGYFPPAEHGRYQEVPCLIGWIKYQADLLAARDDNKTQSQIRLNNIRYEREAAELAVYNKEHVSLADIAPKLRNIGLHQRAVLQHKLERELPLKLLGRTPEEQLALLKGVVDDYCQIYTDGIARWQEEKTE